MPDAEQIWQFEREKHTPEEFTALSLERFLKVFTRLNPPEGEKDLRAMFDRIHQRWDYHGCDMVAAFDEKYRNLDWIRLEKAVDALVKSSAGNIQGAVEEFWWLMGMGSYTDVLDKPAYFGELCPMIAEKGLDACKARAEEIRKQIGAIGVLEQVSANQ